MRIIILVFLILQACDPEQALENYGLPLFELNIDPDHVATMEANLKTKLKVKGTLDHPSGKHRIEISYSGKSSLFHPKRSYKVRLIDGDIKGIKRFRLSAQGSDPTSLRSLLGFHLFEQAGLLSPQQYPVALRLNHRYQGLYHFIEEVDQDFYSRRGVKAGSIYKAKYGRLGKASLEKQTANDLSLGFSTVEGDESFQSIKHLIEVLDDESLTEEKLQQVLNLDQILTYLALSVSLNHWDGYQNNFFFYVHDKLLSISPWDLDHILATDMTYTPGDFLQVNYLLRKIVQIPEIRERYIAKLKNYTSEEEFNHRSRFLEDHQERLKEAYKADPYLRRYKLDEELEKTIESAKSWITDLKSDIQESL